MVKGLIAQFITNVRITGLGVFAVLAGSCGGYFRTGQHVQAGGEPHGKLLVSLTHAMDKPVSTFGVPQYSQGPLGGLT